MIPSKKVSGKYVETELKELINWLNNSNCNGEDLLIKDLVFIGFFYKGASVDLKIENFDLNNNSEGSEGLYDILFSLEKNFKNNFGITTSHKLCLKLDNLYNKNITLASDKVKLEFVKIVYGLSRANILVQNDMNGLCFAFAEKDNTNLKLDVMI